MTDATAPRMRWWGWGEEGHDRPVPSAAASLLRREVGMGGARRPPVPRERVRLPEQALGLEARRRLEKVVGADYVRDDRLTRVTHAAGKSYPDLVRLRAGDGSGAPDAVVYPATHEEVAELLAVCAADGAAVVPFGGGTSVVGGVEALRGKYAAAVTIDLARAHRLLAADSRALTATLQAGMSGPALERGLAERGLTLGHLPQSFEFSTVGGWIATRSAGQASTGYGRIDEAVLGLRCAAPAGEVRARPVPATAAGPDPRQLLLGSEGTLGVVTEATLRVAPRPAVRVFEGYSFPSFTAGVEVLRRLAQAGAAPDVCRLSDEDETAFGAAMITSAIQRWAAAGYLAARGRRRGCLAIFGFEGPQRRVRLRRLRARRLLTGAVALGTGPGDAWARSRFTTPYLRDELLTRRVLVDTLETATTWDNVPALYRAVGGALRDALAARGTPAYVGCHVSHLYPSGCSLYYTYFARQQPGAELEQWEAAKAAASAAVVAYGGTISHHHGVGRDHAPWLASEAGALWPEVLRAAKSALDPPGIMNPGKLIDLPGERA